MNFDCKVYQYDDKAERWQLRDTCRTSNADDGFAAATIAVNLALFSKQIEPDFTTAKGAWIRVLVEMDGGIPVGYEVSLKIDVDAVDMLDSNATAKMADPLRRNT